MSGVTSFGMIADRSGSRGFASLLKSISWKRPVISDRAMAGMRLRTRSLSMVS
jgi:hypothetical protein